MTEKYKAAVIILSDKASRGEREDKSGALARELLEGAGYEVTGVTVLPDERQHLEEELKRISDNRLAGLVITSGGTGFSPRDVTPEATLAIAERNVPGIAEAIRANGARYTDKSMLSRGVSVLRKQTLIINLPGSPKAVREGLEFVLKTLPHALDILTGRASECGGVC